MHIQYASNLRDIQEYLVVVVSEGTQAAHNVLVGLHHKSAIRHLNFNTHPHNFGLQLQVRKPPLLNPSFPYPPDPINHVRSLKIK